MELAMLQQGRCSIGAFDILDIVSQGLILSHTNYIVEHLDIFWCHCKRHSFGPMYWVLA